MSRVQKGDPTYKKACSEMHRSRADIKKLEKRLSKSCNESDRFAIKQKIKDRTTTLKKSVETVYTAAGSGWQRNGSYGYKKIPRNNC